MKISPWILLAAVAAGAYWFLWRGKMGSMDMSTGRTAGPYAG